jgi:hypothetical protein
MARFSHIRAIRHKYSSVYMLRYFARISAAQTQDQAREPT